MDVKDYGIAVRSRAIGMLEAGESQRNVANTLALVNEQCVDGGAHTNPKNP